MTNLSDQMYMNVARLQSGIESGELSATDLVEEALNRIESRNPDINAFLTVCEERARADADRVDQAIADGQSPGPLAGVPIAIKDNICTKDIQTTAGSRMLEEFVPPYNATVIERIRSAGAIIIGKTNLDEFAMGSSGENSAFGPTRNPHNRDRVPGGSSSGSAAAVSAGMVPLALGSDTGGSIRQPAALCGTTGLKPTYGRVSRYGLIAFASSLDQIGTFSRDVQSSSVLLSVIAGHDPNDSTSTSAPVDVTPEKTPPENALDNLTIGLPEEFFGEGVKEQVVTPVEDAIGHLEAAGAEIKTISLPHTEYGIPTYYLIATSEASSNLARYDGMHYGFRSEPRDNLIEQYAVTREEGFGEEVKRRVLLGTFSLSTGYYDAYYKRALKARRLIKQDFDSAFEDVDLIAGPTSPLPAFELGEKMDDPLQLYLCDLLTVTCNLAGLPGISLPCGLTDEDLPVGLQLLAPAFEEQQLLSAATAFQEHTDYHTQP